MILTLTVNASGTVRDRVAVTMMAHAAALHDRVHRLDSSSVTTGRVSTAWFWKLTASLPALSCTAAASSVPAVGSV